MSLVEQVPNLKRTPPSSQAQSAPTTGVASPPAANGDSGPQSDSAKSPESSGKEGGKDKKKGGEGEGRKKAGEGEGKGKKVKKGGGGGGGGGGAGAAVDVSRLNMKIGRIISVERHPDADSLYVEQSEFLDYQFPPPVIIIHVLMTRHFTLSRVTRCDPLI